jgi:hypothetical protein
MSLQQEGKSESTPTPSRRMTLVGERVVPDPMSQSELRLTGTSPTSAATTPTPQPDPRAFAQELLDRAAWKQSVLGAINVLTAVLAVRLIVLVSVSGGIGLTWLALQEPDPMRLGALAIYCAAVVIPVVWLSSR